MEWCRCCRLVAERHPEAARRVAFLLFLALFFTVLGTISMPADLPGMSKVYL